MHYSFTGKNIKVTEAMKDQTIKKLDKLEKFLKTDAEVHVSYSVNKLAHKVEVTVPVQKRILRAEVVSKDMYASIDQIEGVLEKQLKKYKDRLRSKARKDIVFKDEYASIFNEDSNLDGEQFVIEKTKKFALKPMDAEEAVMEMELLNHDFYVFRNSASYEVNVVYKRSDATYGLIEPTI